MRPVALLLAALLAGCVSPSSAQEPASDAAAAAPRSDAAPKRASPGRVATSDPSAEDWEGPPLQRARVVITDAFGAPHRVDVEVANTPDLRQRGMMWRRGLDPGKGMLFAFPYQVVQSFWMVNTFIPLDMLFIDDANRVVGVVERAEPHTRSSRTVGIPSRYVLEVPGGWCEQQGIRAGAMVKFEGLSAIPVR